MILILRFGSLSFFSQKKYIFQYLYLSVNKKSFAFLVCFLWGVLCEKSWFMYGVEWKGSSIRTYIKHWSIIFIVQFHDIIFCDMSCEFCSKVAWTITWTFQKNCIFLMIFNELIPFLILRGVSKIDIIKCLLLSLFCNNFFYIVYKFSLFLLLGDGKEPKATKSHERKKTRPYGNKK